MNLPVAAKRAGLRKALTMKLADGGVKVVEGFGLEAPKTKKIVEILHNLGLTGKRVLIVLPGKDQKVFLSARNIPGVGVVAASDLNAYAVAACDVMVFTADALARIGKTAQESAA
jgi:large subunit ribosomal protein L4